MYYVCMKESGRVIFDVSPLGITCKDSLTEGICFGTDLGAINFIIALCDFSMASCEDFYIQYMPED